VITKQSAKNQPIPPLSRSIKIKRSSMEDIPVFLIPSSATLEREALGRLPVASREEYAQA
jgi:hypothetical protein